MGVGARVRGSRRNKGVPEVTLAWSHVRSRPELSWSYNIRRNHRPSMSWRAWGLQKTAIPLLHLGWHPWPVRSLLVHKYISRSS